MKKTLVLMLAGALYLPASTIVSQTSNGGGVFPGTFSFGFGLTGAWENVSISLSLASAGSVSNPNFTSYLTDQVGPGTIAGIIPAGNEYVASVGGTFVAGGYYTLFSGLSLGAGDYHVTFIPQDGAYGPLGAPGPPLTQVLGPGVSVIQAGTISTPAFPPAGNKTLINTIFNIEVTGDLADVPEPSTFLTGLGGLGLLFLARRRAVQKRRA